MRVRTLQTRFVVASCLLVAATVGGGAWSAAAFARLAAVVDETLAGSQETVDLTAEVASSLEREDDALLLFVGGDGEQARRDLAVERRRGDERFGRILAGPRSTEAGDRAVAGALRGRIDRYRAAGDGLLAAGDRAGGLARYNQDVNPLLRQAVAGCDRLREANFLSMRQAGVRARDEAARGAWLAVAVSALAAAAGVAVSAWLARSVLAPVRELTASVGAVRAGDFGRRVARESADELGQLAAGFNRMAEALSEYRRSSLGELLAAKMTTEATLNALPDAVLMFGADGSLEALNPPARRLLDGTGTGVAARLADMPFPDWHRAAVEAALAGSPPPGSPIDFARTLDVVLGGRPRRLLLTAVPIPGPAVNRFGAVVVLDDVTEFARLDELRSELIGVASHELKSPLTAVRMSLLMLAEEGTGMTARQRQLVAAAVVGCEELGLTIEELLDVTLIESGQLRLNLAAVDLRAVVAAACAALRARFEDAGVGLVPPGEGGAVVVRGDPARLGSVVGNVLANALKYSPAGGVVEVNLSSGQNAQAGGAGPPRIAVTDRGPGVPAEFRERVFEKFFRVEHHTGGRDGGVRGTGIGLYLCREVMRAHGGAIACEPGDGGVGTRFVMSLPDAT